MDAIVHIGLPKTGTTSVQTWLQLNAARLAERGLTYDRFPIPGVRFRRAHVEIGVCQFERAGALFPNKRSRRMLGIASRPDQRAFAERYARAFEVRLAQLAPSTVILSNEGFGFHSRSPDHVAALDGWLRQFFDRVRYVVYLRRQEDTLASIYNQALRNGEARPLDDFAADNAVIDFAALAERWTGVVGRDALDIRLFEPDALLNGDLIADFAQAIGTEAAGTQSPETMNVSLSAAAAAVVRAFNARMAAKGGFDPIGDPLARAVQETIAERHRGGRKLRLSPQTAARVRAANADSNERLRAAWFPDRDALFRERPATTADGATAMEVAEIAIDLVEALHDPLLAASEPSAQPARQPNRPRRKRRADRPAHTGADTPAAVLFGDARKPDTQPATHDD